MPGSRRQAPCTSAYTGAARCCHVKCTCSGGSTRCSSSIPPPSRFLWTALTWTPRTGSASTRPPLPSLAATTAPSRACWAPAPRRVAGWRVWCGGGPGWRRWGGGTRCASRHSARTSRTPHAPPRRTTASTTRWSGASTACRAERPSQASPSPSAQTGSSSGRPTRWRGWGQTACRPVLCCVWGLYTVCRRQRSWRCWRCSSVRRRRVCGR
mmetsp:Transcript_48100/g.96351  ORF Transcript_48100/g.96351 Transcript_48100/m.96351 type:complete len:211 (+) Transcript_48100:16-648(+)